MHLFVSEVAQTYLRLTLNSDGLCRRSVPLSDRAGLNLKRYCSRALACFVRDPRYTMQCAVTLYISHFLQSPKSKPITGRISESFPFTVNIYSSQGHHLLSPRWSISMMFLLQNSVCISWFYFRTTCSNLSLLDFTIKNY
jgi:hypothetical protein